MDSTEGDSLEVIVHEPEGVADSAIIWLHGLGADAHDFEPIMPALGLQTTRFVFPNAPVRPVTINGGMRMRAWFDFVSLDFAEAVHFQQLDASIALIAGLVEKQIAQGIRPERIVLAGFSQGGVVALLTALTGKWKTAGVLALSTFIPQARLQETWPQQPPVLQCHGTEDPVIPLVLARETVAALQAAGVFVDFREYPMAHQVCEEEIAAIRQTVQAWLRDTRASLNKY